MKTTPGFGACSCENCRYEIVHCSVQVLHSEGISKLFLALFISAPWIPFALSPKKLNYTRPHDNGIERVRVLHICVKPLEFRQAVFHRQKPPFKYLTKQLKFQFAQSRFSLMN